jgi:hypothetical protein
MSQIETTLVINGFDKTQNAFKSLDKNLKKTTSSVDGMKKRMEGVTAVSKKMAKVGSVAFGALALTMRSFVNEAMEAERVTVTFDAMTKSIGTTSVQAVEGLRKATRGLVNDTELMKAGNKFMAMGLATNTDEMNQLSEMATKLGSAMGNDATSSMENFALMLANQSILRLDSFGISSGKVRERILELTTGTEQLTREQAFMQATMEAGQASMDKLGETALTNGEKMQAFNARMANLKQTIGDALIPVLTKLLDTVQPVIDRFIVWSEKNPEMVARILMITTAVAGLVAIVGILGVILVPVIAGFTLLLSPIGLVVMAITLALIPVIMLLVQHWDTLKNGAVTAFKNIGITMLAWASVVESVFVNVGLKLQLLGIKISNFWENTKQQFKDGANYLGSMAEGFANMWVKAVNTVIKALNTIQVSIPDWVPKIGGNSFGVNIPNVGEVSIPRLAEGGIATKSVLANIGEAGPEAIIPLNKLNQFGVGGQPIIVNIDTFIGEEDFAETIGDKLAVVLMRNQQIQA